MGLKAILEWVRRSGNRDRKSRQRLRCLTVRRGVTRGKGMGLIPSFLGTALLPAPKVSNLKNNTDMFP